MKTKTLCQKHSKTIYHDKVILTQTDTTVGFLSTNEALLARAKKRDSNQPFLLCVDSFKKQKNLTRTPKKYRSLIRRSKKTTYLYPNKKAIRVVKDERHNQILKKFDFLYSTSANKHQKPYNLSYAENNATIMIRPPEGFLPNPPSPIIILTKKCTKILR